MKGSRCRVRIPGPAAAAVVAAALCGCFGRGNDPVRYRVVGSVTFAGKPVHSGRITFVPDSKKGNVGPAGYADIRQGTFDTADGGRGAVAGPHVVNINGYSDETITIMDAGVPVQVPQRIFGGYEVGVEIEPEEPKVDIDVPASARQRG